MHIDNASAAVVGVALALVVALFARVVGLDRDRAFYPTVLVVIAVLYDLFAVLGGSWQALRLELVGTGLFIVAAVIGFRRNLWIVAAGLAAHGLYDFVHPHVVDNPGVPAWWPAFCGAYDVAAGVVFGWLLSRNRPTPKP
jgi:hypothetical protein